MDYAGSLCVKSLRDSNINNKVYIFLFTCCSYRALVLDLVPDCTAASVFRGHRRNFAHNLILKKQAFVTTKLI